jgi:type I restriction enzyme S subunit
MSDTLPLDWEVVTIGKLCERTGGTVQTGPFGSDLHASDYSPTGIPVVMPANLGKNSIVEDGIARVSSDHVARLRVHRLAKDDIIFPRRGDIARYAVVDEHQVGWLCGTGCLRIRFGANEIIDPHYLGYWLGTSVVENWLLGNAVGTTMPNLNTSILKALPVSLPSLPEQREIARILGALDDKIELNHRMNATLEATAHTLFHSWFVEFDPVHAKAEGRQPDGMDAETAALFPSAFEESALGWIPQGWNVKPLSEAIQINPSRRLQQGELAPYLAMDSMPTSSARATEWIYRETGSGARFMNGDVLFARITPCLENGKTAFVDFLKENEIGWGSTEYIIMRSGNELPLQYAYFVARTPELREYAIRNMSGTSGRQRVNASAFDHFLIVTPNAEVAARFGRYVGDVFAKMKASDEESRTLAQTRDALLPKLISGQLRVGRE